MITLLKEDLIKAKSDYHRQSLEFERLSNKYFEIE